MFLAIALHLISVNSALYTRWTIDPSIRSTPLERHQQSHMAGVSSDQNYFIVSTTRGFLEKRSVQTGEVEWQSKLTGISQASWTVDGEFAYGGDTKGKVYAIRLSDGGVEWSADAKGIFFARPLVDEARVYIMNSLGTVQAFDKKTGEWKWQKNDPQSKSAGVWSERGASFFQGLLIEGFSSSTLMALEPQTGDLRWQESFAIPISSTDQLNDVKAVAANDKYLIVSSFGGDVRVWEKAGVSKRLTWKKPFALHVEPVFTENDRVILSTRDGKVISADLRNGFIHWEYTLPAGLAGVPAVTADGSVVFGSSAGRIFVLSPQGKLLAQTEDKQTSFWNAPLIVGENDFIITSSRGILRRVYLN